MQRIILVLCLFVIALAEGVCRNLRGQGQEYDDTYVLSYRWSPGFCDESPANKKLLLCQQPTDHMKEDFVIDGLWIQQPSSAEVLMNCDGDDYDPYVMRGANWDQLVRYWPNYKFKEYEDQYQSHWENAWNKYGKCSGVSQVDYFSHALQMLKAIGTPEVIRDNVGGEVEIDMVKPSLAGLDLASSLQCQKNEYLLGAMVCWAKGPDGSPLIQEVCPTNVQEMNNCDMGILQIPMFL